MGVSSLQNETTACKGQSAGHERFECRHWHGKPSREGAAPFQLLLPLQKGAHHQPCREVEPSPSVGSRRGNGTQAAPWHCGYALHEKRTGRSGRNSAPCRNPAAAASPLRVQHASSSTHQNEMLCYPQRALEKVSKRKEAMTA